MLLYVGTLMSGGVTGWPVNHLEPNAIFKFSHSYITAVFIVWLSSKLLGKCEGSTPSKL